MHHDPRGSIAISPGYNEGITNPDRSPDPPSSISDMSRQSEADSFETPCSSLGSCDLESTIALTAKAHRDKIIEQINTWVASCLKSRLSLTALQVRGGEDAQDSQNHSTSRPRSAARPPEGPPHRRIRLQENDKELGDDESDEDDPGQPGRDNSVAETRDGIVFACPYVKHNPRKYSKTRCATRGWPSVHRLK